MKYKRKFLGAIGMQDSILTERASNARRRRDGLLNHPTRTIVCGCPARSCGAFYCVMRDITIPTPAECDQHLADDNRKRKPPKKSCDPKEQQLECVHFSGK